MRSIAKTLSQKNGKKNASYIGIFWANKLNKFIRIIRTWTSYLPFGNCYLPLFKIIIINSCMEMKRLLMNPPSRCGLLIPIWLLSSFFIFLRVDNVIAIWCVLKEIEKERKKERKKGRLVKFQKTEFAAINIFQIFYWFGNQVFRNDDGGEILGSLSKYDGEEQWKRHYK